MQCNYFFLRQLSKSLEIRLKGFRVMSCFSQEKDELMIELGLDRQSFFIKAVLTPQLTCLAFPRDFQRAKKNSVDLFPTIISQQIVSVRQFQNERTFSLILENGQQILFKLHGNQANVVVTSADSVLAIFKNQLKSDLQLQLHDMDRHIDWSREYFFAHQEALHRTYFVFGAEVWRQLEALGFGEKNIEARWDLFQSTLQQLRSPRYHIRRDEHGRILFSLLQGGHDLKVMEDPIEAVTEFYYLYTSNENFRLERTSATAALQAKLKAARRILEKNRTHLHQLEGDDRFKQLGDLIMANLHLIKAGQTQVVVPDLFNDNQPITIALKPEIAPQKSAENYYRKGKNQHIEIEKLRQAIAQKEEEVASLQLKLETLGKAESLDDLRKIISPRGSGTSAVKAKRDLPFHTMEFRGYQIFIGKNATNNDLLTLKYAHKDDLWLHAKDVAGSHVIVKHKSGQSFPRDVIERAAEVAAYFSKRKNESLCPVAYTLKKYVRKRKGDPPGAMVVDREEVILVTPTKIN